MRTDKRYGTKHWRETAKLVLVRDLYQCYVTTCEEHGAMADHINPVYPGMPDSEFFDMGNLRASCKRHNWARGVAARLLRDETGVVEQRRSAYSYGHGFLKHGVGHESPLANLYTQSRDPALFGDFTRRAPERGDS